MKAGLFLSVVCLILHASAHAAKEAERPVSILVGGDVMAPVRVKEVAYKIGLSEESYFGSLFSQLKPLFASADIAFANLETPVAKSEVNKPRPLVFNAPETLPEALKWLGLGIVSIANNHILDQKMPGVSETIEAVNHAGLRAVGAGRDRDSALAGEVIEVRGVKVGFLAFTALVNGTGIEKARATRTPYINLVERREELYAAVADMKSRADVLMVSIHWGIEYDTQPQPWQKKLAKELHKRGVDVILGHHPHVLQPAVWRRAENGRKQLTLYSLGNLISNQSSDYQHGRSPVRDGNTRDSVLINLQVTRDGVKRLSYVPLWIDNWQGPEEGVRTVSIKKELELVEKDLEGRRPSPQKSFLLARQRLLNSRLHEIYKTLFPLAPPPPAASPVRLELGKVTTR